MRVMHHMPYESRRISSYDTSFFSNASWSLAYEFHFVGHRDRNILHAGQPPDRFLAPFLEFHPQRAGRSREDHGEGDSVPFDLNVPNHVKTDQILS